MLKIIKGKPVAHDLSHIDTIRSMHHAKLLVTHIVHTLGPFEGAWTPGVIVIVLMVAPPRGYCPSA